MPDFKPESTPESTKLPSSNQHLVVDEITDATTRVSTGMLVRNGISTLRILSESQFREVLKRQEARLAAQQSSAKGAGLDGEVDQELAKAYENRWAELKSKHEHSLGAVEARMEKLSRAFHGLSGVLGKLESQTETRPESEVKPATLAPITPAAAPERQKALLRQLLLNGETPAK